MGTMSLKVLPVYSSKWCIVLQTDSYKKCISSISMCTFSLFVPFIFFLCVNVCVHACMRALLISRSMNFWKITWISFLCSIDKLWFPYFFYLYFPLLAPITFFCFSNHQRAVFSFLLLFTSVISPSVVSWKRQILLKLWPIQLAFVCRILFRNVVFSPIHSRTCSLVNFSDYLFFFLHSPPAPHFRTL